MKKKILALVLCIALIGAVAVQVSAEFTPSKTLQEDSVVEAVLVDKDGNEIEAEVEAVGPAATMAERAAFAKSSKPATMITPVSLAAEVTEDANVADKTQMAENGLTYEENELLVQVFDIVKESKTTEETLKTFGVDEEALAEVLPEGAKIADYEPAALFDVRANEAAQELIGEDGTFSVTAEVVGVKAGDEVVVISIAENDDEEAAEDAPELLGEVLESVVNDDSTVTFTATKNGPVLILVNPGK